MNFGTKQFWGLSQNVRVRKRADNIHSIATNFDTLYSGIPTPVADCKRGNIMRNASCVQKSPFSSDLNGIWKLVTIRTNNGSNQKDDDVAVNKFMESV